MSFSHSARKGKTKTREFGPLLTTPEAQMFPHGSSDVHLVCGSASRSRAVLFSADLGSNILILLPIQTASRSEERECKRYWAADESFREPIRGSFPFQTKTFLPN